MVNLLSGSAVDQNKYPHSYKWDTLVRKHHSAYQELIDAQTYRLQRIQRGILVKHPPYRHSPTLSYTTQNYLLSDSSKKNRKLEKLTKTKSTSTNKSTPASPPTSIEPSTQAPTFPGSASHSEDLFLPIPVTSPSPYQLDLL